MNNEKLKMIELFSGIGAQERAIRQLGIPYNVVATCDLDANAILSYAAMRYDFDKEFDKFNFPFQATMIKKLQAKGVGYDFQKEKDTITTRTSLTKLMQYYLADKLSENLGDISKVDRLPNADLVTYSFPCTDLSVSGKREGMVNKCACGYSWPIDFSDSNEALICPQCGKTVNRSTRSGLLGQVQRLLTIAYENNELPKYLLLENVKNLVGKQFKPQFDSWVKWLDSIGYNTYWKVLNSKHFGMPQNRERVFAISIRKDIDNGTFQFPEEIPLTIRLKDILEKNVGEKYYLPDDRIEKILNQSFMKEKNINPIFDDDISPIRLGNIYDEKFGTGYAGNVWDKEGISPALQTAQGGNRQPLVLDEVEEPKVVKIGQASCDGSQCGTVYDTDNLAPTLIAGCHGYAMGYIAEEQEPFIVASRGRNPENPSDRTAGIKTEQRFEPNKEGICNCITSVQKDSYVVEPKVIKKPIIYDDYNSRIGSDQDVINTLTCNCGAAAERNGVKIIEPCIVEDHFQGSRDARIYTEYSSTLRQSCNGLKVANGDGEVVVKPIIRWRIRKLTSKECFRLMGFTDKDHDRAAQYVSNSSRYKQAGNSIVVGCLIAIFSSLFIKDGYKAEVWTKYFLNYNAE